MVASRHPDDPLDLNRRLEGQNYRTPLFDAAYNKQHGMVKVRTCTRAGSRQQAACDGWTGLVRRCECSTVMVSAFTG